MIRLINLLLCLSIVAIAAGVAWVLSIEVSWKLIIVIGIVGFLADLKTALLAILNSDFI